MSFNNVNLLSFHLGLHTNVHIQACANVWVFVSLVSAKASPWFGIFEFPDVSGGVYATDCAFLTIVRRGQIQTTRMEKGSNRLFHIFSSCERVGEMTKNRNSVV